MPGGSVEQHLTLLSEVDSAVLNKWPSPFPNRLLKVFSLEYGERNIFKIENTFKITSLYI